MDNYIDLHIHSTASDGIYTREEIIRKAKEKGLKTISITDHDTLEAYDGFDINSQGIDILPGVELVCTAGKSPIEILCYGFDIDLMRIFMKEHCPDHVKDSYYKTIRECKVFKELGVDISFDAKNFDYLAPGAWAIRALWLELIKNPKAVELMKQEDPKFCEVDKYFFRQGINNRHSKFFVDMSDIYVSLDELREFCDKTGALMFLAHPYEYTDNMDYVLNIAKDYVHGIEVYHPSADEEGRAYLEAFAKEHNLLISGGSDYHGFRGKLNSERIDKSVYDDIIKNLAVSV